MPSLEQMYEGSDEGPDDGLREAPSSEASTPSEAEPVAATELPSLDSVGKVKAVWGGVLGFISATLAMYANMADLTEEERLEKQYKWKQRQAVDTSDSEERALRVKYVLEYKEERERTDAFRAEQLEHMRRCETIERERTDRIVATLRDGFKDVVIAMGIESPPPAVIGDRDSSKAF